MIEINIAIIKNISIFLKLASDNMTSFNIKYFQEVNNIPLDQIFTYIIIDKNIKNELNNIKSFLEQIKYNPSFLYFYSQNESIKDFKDIINNINISKVYDINLEPDTFWKTISLETTTNTNNLLYKTSQQKNITNCLSNFEYDNVLQNILKIIHTTPYTSNLSDAIYSILETLSSSHNINSLGIYLFNKQIYFGLIKSKKIKIKKFINKKDIITLLNNNLKNPQLLYKKNNLFIEENQSVRSSYMIPLIHKDNVSGYFIINLTDKQVDNINLIVKFLTMYADTFIPVYLNYERIEEVNKKNIEYSKLINDLNRLYQDLQIHSVAIDQIRQITRNIFSSRKLENILNEIVNDIEHLLDVEYSLIFFKTHRTKKIKINNEKFLDIIKFQENKSNYLRRFCTIYKKYKTVKKNIIYPDDVLYNIKNKPIKNYLGIPLEGNKNIKGFIFVFNKPGIFNETDLFMLRTLSESSITAILNAQLIEHLDKLFLDTINTLAATIEARDKYTKGHTDRVGAFVKLITKKLNWSEKKIREAYIGGILHDIGKIGIDDAILRKTTRLTFEEFEEIKKHCQIGYNIIINIKDLKNIGSYILYHHEKYDGNGYPFGLKGEDIPIEGRVVAIADSFDAMISHRPYKKALPIEQAIEEIERCKNSHFDPILADTFITLYNEGSLDPILKTIEE